MTLIKSLQGDTKSLQIKVGLSDSVICCKFAVGDSGLATGRTLPTAVKCGKADKGEAVHFGGNGDSLSR